MKRRDLIILVAATLLILGVAVALGAKYLGGGEAPEAVTVTPVVPTFDEETVKRLEPFFTVQFDFGNLGRPDPFAGI